MDYVSTRGIAPALGFSDVLLAGLARDGGLYVPGNGRGCLPRRSPGLAGLPYAAAAVEVMRPFIGDDIAEGDLRRMADEAYATFRDPAVAPLRELRPGALRARTLPRPDARIQGRRPAAPGAADGPCAPPARAARDDRRGDLRRHRRGGGRGVPRPRQRRAVHPVSEGTRIAVPAAPDDDGRGRQCPCAGGRGDLRRLPGDREGRCSTTSPSATGWDLRESIQSIGRGSSRRLSTISPPPWRSALRSRRCPSPCRRAISATSTPAMPRSGWGLASTAWWWRPIPTTSWRARSPPAATSCSPSWRRHRRPWTSRCRRISSGCFTTPTAATARRSAG